MNDELWNKILAYDFDDSPSEYGFSTRLAKENFWTKEFTHQAILEYKKFMYLASTAEAMVSPSEIIDHVWHQHLIFTRSYQEFCTILGKQIQHIPSTHNREEIEKFKLAKVRTKKLYESRFGKQPKNIWTYNTMFESLNLRKAKFKLRTCIIVGILAFIFLIGPSYFLLKPLLVQIENPYFILGYIALSVMMFLLLDIHNKSKLKKIISDADETSFIYNLHPLELVYLKTHQIANVIHGTVSELVDRGVVKVNKDKSIQLEKSDISMNSLQLEVANTLTWLGKTYYSSLFGKLISKPVFGNIPNSMDAFTKYFNKSKKFGHLFCTNFAVLILLLLLSFSRIITGISRDKPVILITLVSIVLIVSIAAFLQRLTKQISKTTIPDIYKVELLPTRQVENDWQWTYFLSGTSALSTSFVPLTVFNYDSNTQGTTGSCGSSCSSSCGGACGGCGGD